VATGAPLPAAPVIASAAGPAAPGASSAAPAGRTAGSSSAPRPATSSAATSCGPLTSTDVGVTRTQIKIAAVTLDLGGAIGNSAVGLASEAQQEQMARAMVDEINSHGGIACRKLSVTFFKGNPIDSSTAQQACLNIANGGFFAAIDMGGFSNPPGVGDCVPQHKVPLFASTSVTPKELQQYAPYLMSFAGDAVEVQHNAILAMSSRGWFSPANGFKKLGILMDECSPEVNQATFDTLAQIGISKNQISVADVACPTNGFASPGDMEAAVLQHVRDNVTNLIPVIGGGSFKEYSAAAQRQGFKPKYTSTDYDGFEITATGGTGPDVDNFDGTVSVSTTRIGENTSGLTDPATQHCIDVFKRHGLSADLVMPTSPSSYPEGGVYCSYFETFAAAVQKDPGLTRTGISVGLDKLGKVSMAYLLGDAVFDRPGKLTGGDFWWVVQFSKACTCWKVIDQTQHPTYA
jgi:hypothetical protein